MWFREPCPPPGARSTALAFDSTQRGPRAGQLCPMTDAWLRAVNKIFDDDDKATRPLITKGEMSGLDEGVTIVSSYARKGG